MDTISKDVSDSEMYSDNQGEQIQANEADANPDSKTKRKRPRDETGKQKERKKPKGKKLREPGVVYLATVPPYMKPQKLRDLLDQYGNVTKLYLAPEDETVWKKRKKSGGNTKKKYTEGWIQFAEKKVAKKVAMMLNGQQIGGKKRNFYYYDTWNIKYLSGFKWEHLTEKMIYESKTRQARLRAEIAKTRKTNEYYLERVTQARAIEEIHSRKVKRKTQSEDHADSNSEKQEHTSKDKSHRRQFFQHSPTGASMKQKQPPLHKNQSEKKSKLLSQIL